MCRGATRTTSASRGNRPRRSTGEVVATGQRAEYPSRFVVTEKTAVMLDGERPRRGLPENDEGNSGWSRLETPAEHSST